MQKDNHLARLTRPSKPAKDSELAWESGGCGVYESVSKSHRGRLWTRPDPGAKNKRDCDAKFPTYWLCVQYGSRIEAGGDWVHKGATHPPVLYVCKMYMHACTHTHTHTHTAIMIVNKAQAYMPRHKRHPSVLFSKSLILSEVFLSYGAHQNTHIPSHACTHIHTHTHIQDVENQTVQTLPEGAFSCGADVPNSGWI